MLIASGLQLSFSAAVSAGTTAHQTDSRDMTAAPQKVQIKGTVKDSKGEPIPGASVYEKGTTNGTITDEKGNFTFTLSSSDATLVVSCIGYSDIEIVPKGKTVFDVTMEDDAELLDEVVAIGYGTARKSSVTGSITKVNGDELAGFPSVSVEDALQGRAAGVYISPSSQPGTGTTIRIRGSRSLKASNSPLVIVDGMPGTFDNVSPQDIKSIEILKDAAATAIYGSRAANGVILITTKGTTKDDLTIELTSYAGMNTYNFADMISAEEYEDQIWCRTMFTTYGTDAEAWKNSDITKRQALENFDPLWADNYYNKGINFDWRKALFSNVSFNTGHTISVNYRGNRFSNRLSYSFNDDNSYYKTVNFKRHLLTNNVRFNPAKWLEVNQITRLMLRERDGYPSTAFDAICRMTPFESPYVDNDPEKGLVSTIGRERFANALYDYEPGNFVDKHNTNRADVILGITAHPLKWLTLNTNLKLGFSNSSDGEYRDSHTSAQNNGYNYAQMEKSYSFDYTWNGLITADKDFGDHHISATGVVEAIKDTDESLYAYSQNIPAAYMDYHFLQSGDINQTLSSSYSMSSLLSFLGRFQYDYKSKYLLNVAVRRDGSSRLAEGNKWHTFPSASVAWRISEEPFMRNTQVDELKLRLSYGEIGNQSISEYQTLTRLKSKSYSWAGAGFYTWQPDGLANTGLTWEVSKSINAGVDFALFNRKFSGTVEYYNTRNENQLQQRTLPETTGFGSLWMNIGTTRSTGIELSLSGTLKQTKDFLWTVGGNFSRNWSTIVSLLDGKDDVSNAWFIGKPLGVVYDYVFDGIWQLDEKDQATKYKSEPGKIKVKDIDGDGAITASDKQVLGQTEPKFMTSIQTNLKWKNFDFTANFVGQFGHMITSSNYVDAFNAERWNLDSGKQWWTPLNGSNEWPRIHGTQDMTYSSVLTRQKGDFIKIQNISLGYDLSKAVKGIEKIRVYVQGRNIAYLYKACPGKMNPEQPNSMFTIPASYVLGINLTF